MQQMRPKALLTLNNQILPQNSIITAYVQPYSSFSY